MSPLSSQKIMYTETNNDTAGAHHKQGDRTIWSNVRKSTRVSATKIKVGIKEDGCADQKMKRHQAYLCGENEKELSKNKK